MWPSIPSIFACLRHRGPSVDACAAFRGAKALLDDWLNGAWTGTKTDEEIRAWAGRLALRAGERYDLTEHERTILSGYAEVKAMAEIASPA